MKTNHADITVVLDRSGSMDKVRDDTIGGFNTYIAELKKEAGIEDPFSLALDEGGILISPALSGRWAAVDYSAAGTWRQHCSGRPSPQPDR